MADQVRHNAGKLKLGYWLSMTASAFVYSGDTWIDGHLTEAERASDLERMLGVFVRGEDNQYYLLDALLECVGGRDNAAEYFTRACEYGEKKYWRGGFMTGAPISQYIDSAARHLKALRTTGAEYEETYTKDGIEYTAKLNHWEGVCWNIVMIYEVMYHAPQRDDRLFHMGDYSGNEPCTAREDLTHCSDRDCDDCNTVPAPKYVGSRTFDVAVNQARDHALTIGDLPRCEADDGRLSYHDADVPF